MKIICKLCDSDRFTEIFELNSTETGTERTTFIVCAVCGTEISSVVTFTKRNYVEETS